MHTTAIGLTLEWEISNYTNEELNEEIGRNLIGYHSK